MPLYHFHIDLKLPPAFCVTKWMFTLKPSLIINLAYLCEMHMKRNCPLQLFTTFLQLGRHLNKVQRRPYVKTWQRFQSLKLYKKKLLLQILICWMQYKSVPMWNCTEPQYTGKIFVAVSLLPLKLSWNHILTLKEQGVLDGRNGWCILLLFTGLPFLQLYTKLLLSHASCTLWINTS